jgi:predicted aspartyl protease
VKLARAAAIALGLSCASAQAASNCKLVRIAEWEVKPQNNRLIVDGEINGQKVGILLDSGAGTSFVLRAAADRLGLVRQEARGYRAYGVGGETHVEFAVIDELKIGTATRKNWRAMVLGEHDQGTQFSFLLGYDFMDQVDIEYDLAHNAIRIFRPQDCDDVSLAYWTKGASVVKLESDNERPGILVPVRLNGQSILANLDTGAPRSVVSRLVAATLGVGPDNAKAAGTSGGLGPARSDRYIGSFETFAIGDELIRNPDIAFTNLEVSRAATGSRLAAPREIRDMLLGVDFVRAHRILVAHSQRKLYFTYAGGPVFTPRPALTSAK